MISVIIPTYNRRDVVLRAVRSVLRQTYANVEVVVVDDGSTDGTEEVFRDPDPLVRYEKLPKNRGVQAARNRGIELARGEFVYFLDSDDELLPHAMETGMRILEAYPNVGMFAAPLRTDTGELTGFRDTGAGILDYRDLICETKARPRKGGVNIMRKALLEDVRWSAQNLDFIFYRRLARKTKFYYWPEPLGIYHLTENITSLHVNRRIPNPELSIKRARDLVDFIDEFGEDLLRYCPRKYADYAYGAAMGLLLDGKKRVAMTYAFRAVKYQPNKLRYVVLLLIAPVPFSSVIMKVVLSWLRILSLKQKNKQNGHLDELDENDGEDESGNTVEVHERK